MFFLRLETKDLTVFFHILASLETRTMECIRLPSVIKLKTKGFTTRGLLVSLSRQSEDPPDKREELALILILVQSQRID